MDQLLKYCCLFLAIMGVSVAGYAQNDAQQPADQPKEEAAPADEAAPVEETAPADEAPADEGAPAPADRPPCPGG